MKSNYSMLGRSYTPLDVARNQSKHFIYSFCNETEMLHAVCSRQETYSWRNMNKTKYNGMDKETYILHSKYICNAFNQMYIQFAVLEDKQNTYFFHVLS